MKYIIIPARGGSKGIPNKNLKKIGGISLVSWSILHAQYIAIEGDKILVSSDSEKILNEAKKHGVSALKRPKYLSGDKVFTEPVMDQVLSKFKPNTKDIVVLLQPTSPLRTKLTLQKSINSVMYEGYDSSVTLKKIHQFKWKKVNDEYKPLYKDRPRRQDMDGEYCETGSVYVTTYKQYLKSGIRLSGKTYGVITDDAESIDIDSTVDLALAQSLSQAFNKEWDIKKT